MRQTLSIPQWHALAREGSPLPMRILIQGWSMYPLIRKNQDYVTILPLDAPPRRGDIVLFSDPARERYVLHRIWKTAAGSTLTWGDNCQDPDGWIPMDAVWGKAVLIERGKRKIRPHPRQGLLLACVLHALLPARRFAGAIKRRVKRRIKTAKGET